ncbi:hypothetical protein EDI_298510 [Entamoeba dispar SAW760]|uniref:Uncharacterized protein n=1 Tax=Entamoeba dispar (strain ATCC PRA-260 / SAW760) TaxID=370354 RepID=B0E6L3_ENTDS|nr:uncharacterized protein EDI_298510 [Entamoeba dispar SAW760]EDR29846.1 hypothetical protein EDI_298510 [Entamoeba dispar SAW760]|eukprot:EDR29846.1 hypothetical protein EDI_298510 [Entamoeba dispar SAW760]
MIKAKPLITKYEFVIKGIKKYSKWNKQREYLDECVQILTTSTNPKIDILQRSNKCIEPLIVLLTFSSSLDLTLLQLIQMLSMEELIPLTLHDHLFIKLQQMISNETINAKIVQITSSLLTTPLLASLPVTALYNGLTTLTLAATTPILLSSLFSVLSYISTIASTLYPSYIPQLAKQQINQQEANHLIDLNKNYLGESLIEPTEPLVSTLSKYINDLCLSPQYSNLRTYQFDCLFPILSNAPNLFFQIKPLYTLLLQVLIPKLPVIINSTLQYHSTFLVNFSTFPGYPYFISLHMFESSNCILSLFYQFFSTNQSSFVLNKHFYPLIISFLKNGVTIAQPTSVEHISSPKNLQELSYFCFFLLISHMVSVTFDLSNEIINLTLNTLTKFGNSIDSLVCIEKMMRVMVNRGYSICQLLELAGKTKNGWGAVINAIELSPKFKHKEWKCIWKMVEQNHWMTICKYTKYLKETELIECVKELIPIINTLNYYKELINIYEENINKIIIIHPLCKNILKNGVLEDISICEKIGRMISNILGQIDKYENKKQENELITLIFTFINECIKDKKCKEKQINIILNSLEILNEITLPIYEHINELIPIFTIFSNLSQQIVSNSFNIFKQIVLSIHPTQIPINIIYQYIIQTSDINISLSAIQLFSDIIIQLKDSNEYLPLSLIILKQFYLCLKDKRYDIWSSALQTLTQSIAYEGEMIINCIDQLLQDILFPVFNEMKNIYIKLTQSELPKEHTKVLFYMPPLIKQWNDNICILIGGLTRILKYILPYVSSNLKEELYNQLIGVTDMALYNPGMLTCEMILKYNYSLLIQSINEKEDIYKKVFTTYILIGNFISKNNGINTTISKFYLTTSEKLLQDHLIEDVVFSIIQYVSVFPDDFNIEPNGLSTCQQLVFNLIDYILLKYKNCQKLYVSCLCKMISYLISEFKERAQICVYHCINEIYNKLGSSINEEIINQIDIEELKLSILKSKSTLLRIVRRDNNNNQYYQKIMNNINKIIYYIGITGIDCYYDFYINMYTFNDYKELNNIIYQPYQNAINYIYEIIINRKQLKNENNIISKCLLDIQYNGYYDNLSYWKQKILLSLIQIENPIGIYTQNEFVNTIINELERIKIIIEINDENLEYIKIECLDFMNLLKELIKINKNQLDKKKIFIAILPFITLDNSKIRHYVLDILDLLTPSVKFK